MSKMSSFAPILPMVCVALSLVTTASSAEIVVTSSSSAGPGTLRQAIVDADAGDTVVFAERLTGASAGPGGMISLGGEQLFIDKDLTIKGSSHTRIQGAFTIERGVTAQFHNLAISADLDHDSLSSIIYNDGTLTMRDVQARIHGKRAGVAAVANYHRITLQDCQLLGRAGAQTIGLYNNWEQTAQVMGGTINGFGEPIRFNGSVQLQSTVLADGLPLGQAPEETSMQW